VIGFDDIEEKEDRSWSPRMLDIVTSDDVDETTANRAVSTLNILGDPRVYQALVGVLEDSGRSPEVRERASRVLSRSNGGTASPEQKQAWQQASDPLLLLHAVRSADRTDSPFLLSIAANENSPLLKHVLVAMTNGFEEPQFQPVKIKALHHPDALVREAACLSIYADQPYAAEESLLAAAGDEEDNVAIAALKSLMHYASQSILLALHEMSLDQSRSEAVAAAIKESYANVLGTFEFSLSFPHQTDQKRINKYMRWLKPVKHLLKAKETYLPKPQPFVQTPQDRAALESERWKWTVVIPEQGIYTTFDDMDGKWVDKKGLFNSINWFAISGEKRTRVANYLVTHQDPWIRENAALPLCAWADDDSLLKLLDDPVRSVRVRAAYWSQFLPPDLFFVPGLVRALTTESSAAVHEIIEAYVVHQNKNVLPEKLVEMALNGRESIAYSCMEALAELKDEKHLRELLPLLEREPLAWTLQDVLLEALNLVGIKAEIPTEWRFVDDMHLQRAMALYG
jgi:HEAT repeat protein